MWYNCSHFIHCKKKLHRFSRISCFSLHNLWSTSRFVSHAFIDCFDGIYVHSVQSSVLGNALRGREFVMARMYSVPVIDK